MSSAYSSQPSQIRIILGDDGNPTIQLLDSDCDGTVTFPDSFASGEKSTRTFQRAESDHKRYWREKVGAYLRNELDLEPERRESSVE